MTGRYDAPMPVGERPAMICAACGEPFEPSPFQAHRQRYCAACRAAGAAQVAHRDRALERFGRSQYNELGIDRWIERTAREVEAAERSGGYVTATDSRWSLALAATTAEATPRLDELAELAAPRSECELVRHRVEIHTPPVHPLDDPSYFDRDPARLPPGYDVGLTFEPALPVRTSWELPLRATAGYRRRLAARRAPDRALARAAVLRAKAERLLAEARALSAGPLPSKDLTFGGPENA